MKKLALLLTMMMVLGFGTAAHAAMSINIDFYGGTSGLAQGTYDTGATVDLVPNTGWAMVDIVLSEVPNDNGAALFGWVLSFDASLMQISALSIDDNIWTNRFERSVDNTAGTVRFNYATTEPDLAVGEVVIGTFRVDCTGPGLDDWFLAELGSFNNLLADGTNYANLYPREAIAFVNQVPIPGAAWLLGSGLLGLVAIRRKKK